MSILYFLTCILLIQTTKIRSMQLFLISIMFIPNYPCFSNNFYFIYFDAMLSGTYLLMTKLLIVLFTSVKLLSLAYAT